MIGISSPTETDALSANAFLTTQMEEWVRLCATSEAGSTSNGRSVICRIKVYEYLSHR